MTTNITELYDMLDRVNELEDRYQRAIAEDDAEGAKLAYLELEPIIARLDHLESAEGTPIQ